MSDEKDDKVGGISDKFRMQIDLQQTDESLRRVRNEIMTLVVQVRKLQQDYARTKIALDAAEARLKVLKLEEFDLNQTAMRQKRAYISRR